MALSNKSYLPKICALFGTISIGFGVNAILRPSNALSFFELPYPTAPAEVKLVDSLLIVYGARDIYMGLSIFGAIYYGHRKVLGFLMLLVSAVAVVDGLVCKVVVGAGEMNHWGYAPIVGAVGAVILGALDK